MPAETFYSSCVLTVNCNPNYTSNTTGTNHLKDAYLELHNEKNQCVILVQHNTSTCKLQVLYSSHKSLEILLANQYHFTKKFKTIT